MAFQKVLNCINDVSDGNIICDEFVYYSKLDRLFFEKWVNFWNDKGIEDGNKIGILTSKNMIIMPIVLSLDSYKCQIEFFNSSVPKDYIENNESNCNVIITDQELNFSNRKKRESMVFEKNNLFLHFFDSIKCQDSSVKTFIYYTSGTTGKPKAIYKSEDAVIAEGQAILKAIGMTENSTILCVAPCVHVFAQSVACIAAVLSRAKVKYMLSVSSPNKIKRMISDTKIDFLITTPFYYNYLCEDEEVINGVGKCISGGARLSLKVQSSDLKVINFYGSTETGVVAINNSIVKKDYVGNIVEGVSINTDDEEIWVNNQKNCRLSIKSSFNAYAFKDNNQILHEFGDAIKLNDYGYISDNEVYVIGRQDNIVNIHGLKVSTIEVENVLMGNIFVKEVNVQKEKSKIGEYIVAYIVLKEENIINEDELISYCKTKVEHYKIPQKIYIVDELQYTESGKKILNKK